MYNFCAISRFVAPAAISLNTSSFTGAQRLYQGFGFRQPGQQSLAWLAVQRPPAERQPVAGGSVR